jgi:hypothetical protein
VVKSLSALALSVLLLTSCERNPHVQPVRKMLDQVMAHPQVGVVGWYRGDAIPVRESGHVFVVVVAGSAVPAPGGDEQIYGPKVAAFVDPITAQVDHVKTLVTGDVCAEGEVGRLLKTTKSEKVDQDARERDQKDLDAAYDTLLPLFAASASSVPPEAAAAARRFKQLFPKVSIGALDPCYRALGHEWFAWIDRAAAG